MFLFAAALGYYDSLNEAQKLAYDLEPAVLDGTATLAEQMAYKIAIGEKLTIAEMNRLNRNDRAVVELGRLLGARLANLGYSELAATLNSTATKNANFAGFKDNTINTHHPSGCCIKASLGWLLSYEVYRRMVLRGK